MKYLSVLLIAVVLAAGWLLLRPEPAVGYIYHFHDYALPATFWTPQEREARWQAIRARGIPTPKPAHSARVSWYGEPWRGRRTASGSRYDPDRFTCAHKSLPFGTRVIFSKGNKSVICTVTDRGPYIPGRQFDLTTAAFKSLAPLSRGVIKVEWREAS